MKKPWAVLAIAVLLVPLVGSDRAEAEDITKTWRCNDSIWGGETLVTLTEDTHSEGASVKTFGIHHEALFEIRGLNRRWDFGPRLQYSFIIKPDGTGLYYDFTTETRTTASAVYKCK